MKLQLGLFLKIPFPVSLPVMFNAKAFSVNNVYM